MGFAPFCGAVAVTAAHADELTTIQLLDPIYVDVQHSSAELLKLRRSAVWIIVANSWIDLKAARADKDIYCAEDESVPGSTSSACRQASPISTRPTL